MTHFTEQFLPGTHHYTIFNYDNNELKKVGNTSIIGNIPNEIKVKDNLVMFEYWPYESPIDYTEKVRIKLDIE